jgi:hypothetical protein
MRSASGFASLLTWETCLTSMAHLCGLHSSRAKVSWMCEWFCKLGLSAVSRTRGTEPCRVTQGERRNLSRCAQGEQRTIRRM